MKNDDRHIHVSLREQAFSRPLLVYLASLFPATVLVTILYLARPELSAQEIGVGAAVPLVALYVLSRLYSALAKRPGPKERDEFRHTVARMSVVFRSCLTAQALAIAAVLVALVSAPIYAYLGFTWAWVFSLRAAGLLTGLIALSIFVSGCLMFAAEVHVAGELMRKCVEAAEFIQGLLLGWFAAARDGFHTHSHIKPLS